jgi:hypothetical protein
MAGRVASLNLRRKLGKLLPLLGSDNVGERAGAAAAIKRLLAAEGLDFHDLADNMGSFLEASAPSSFATGVQPTETRQWTTLDELFMEEEFDFRDLAHEQDAPQPTGTLDEVLAEIDRVLNPKPR